MKACFWRPSGKRVSNAWATCPREGDNTAKAVLIPHENGKPHGFPLKDGLGRRPRMGPRPISWLAVQGTTKATIGSRSERMNGHIGTETRPRLLREAAVGNLRNGRKPDGATPREREGPRVVKLCCRGRGQGGGNAFLWTVPDKEAAANYVPAAAVTRRRRALSGIIGRKGSAGGRESAA